jgi:hypothetical protein
MWLAPFMTWAKCYLLSLFCFVFLRRGLPMLALNLRFSCFSFLSAGITAVSKPPHLTKNYLLKKLCSNHCIQNGKLLSTLTPPKLYALLLFFHSNYFLDLLCNLPTYIFSICLSHPQLECKLFKCKGLCVLVW